MQPLQSPIIPCKSVHFQILHSLPLNPFSTEQPPAIHLAKSKSAQVTAGWPLSSSFQSHRESHANGTLEKYALDISSTFLLPDCHPSASGLPVLSSFVQCDTCKSGLTPCYTSDIFSMGSFWFTHTPHSGPCSSRSSFTSSPGTASGSLYSP